MDGSERFNSISHLIGAALALVGAVALVLIGLRRGDLYHIVAFSLYGTTLFLLYSISTIYHGLPPGRAKRIFRMLDHQAIYLLIAGSYTPFMLITLKNTVGWWMFGAVWSLAILGVVLVARPKRGRRVLPMTLYFVMGWLILLAIKPLLAVLPAAGFLWLLTGGILYSSGILFYALDHRSPWMHGVWHLFVLGGSISHYIAILVYI
ncbi:PAQR family membrane homeostasis protein TrhA [Amphritea pacifica]|uniref:PAQR family membrane homeostasis protein TrhA n=1 Tax=Amphritea pacifica TaxID=2811233 RepID=UPI001966CE19|nr:hemolysin III family protein [Amphritea pacifica]MBN1007639.1 hemolysin III family protein [Amphritea pacifica]